MRVVFFFYPLKYRQNYTNGIEDGWMTIEKVVLKGVIFLIYSYVW